MTNLEEIHLLSKNWEDQVDKTTKLPFKKVRPYTSEPYFKRKKKLCIFVKVVTSENCPNFKIRQIDR